VPPALRAQDLPRLDLLLVSHAHMDHYDIPSLKSLPRDVPTIMPAIRANSRLASGLNRLQELDWGQSAEVDGVRIERCPCGTGAAGTPGTGTGATTGSCSRSTSAAFCSPGHRVLRGIDLALKGRRPDVVMLPIGDTTHIFTVMPVPSRRGICFTTSAPAT